MYFKVEYVKGCAGETELMFIVGERRGRGFLVCSVGAAGSFLYESFSTAGVGENTGVL